MSWLGYEAILTGAPPLELWWMGCTEPQQRHAQSEQPSVGNLVDLQTNAQCAEFQPLAVV